MAVLRLSKSGGQLQFITDEGLVFGASSKLVSGLLGKSLKGGGSKVVVLARLPFQVSVDRFGKSPLWDPESKSLVNDDGNVVKDFSVKIGKDGLSKFRVEKKLLSEGFSDKVV